MPIDWDQRYARRVQRIKGSAIRELLKLTEMPGAISLAGGLPAAEIFPLEQILAATQRILAQQGQQALQYGATEGYTPLRDLLAQRMTVEGVKVTRENILITSGSQQGLDLLGKLLVNPGEPWLVESPTYMGALQAFNPYGPEYVAVRSDHEGIVISELEVALQRHPGGMYVLPSFQNPSGVTFTLERRQQLIELAGRYNVPVIEDDPYSELRFEGEPLQIYQGNVILLNTFSKVLTPGLRVAWIVAPAEVIRKLTLIKQGADLHTATLNQMIAYELTREGFLEEHVPVIRALYRERRDAMLAALEEYFPDTIIWTRPQGGLFLWVTLPEGLDAAQLLGDALEYRIAFVPGAAFHANGGGTNTMRLSFSNVNAEQIEEGMRRLGKLLHNRMLHS